MKLHCLDLMFLDTPGLIAGWVLESGGDVALIETGPGSCHAALVKGLAGLGMTPKDVRQVFVTHIHLDHSGGAGWWAQQGARVYVHGRGAAHLIDPARLIDSATRIYGDQMDRLWGPILPAPAEQVTVLEDGASVEVGALKVTAWDTPGHARHHLAFIAEDTCFTGDVAGMRVPGCDYISVTAAPPQFEAGPYQASVDRLLAAKFARLCLTHFGEVTNAEAHLQTYRERIAQVQGDVAQWCAEGCDSAEIAHRYEAIEHKRALAAGASEAQWAHYQMGNGTAMCASGIELSVRKGRS